MTEDLAMLRDEPKQRATHNANEHAGCSFACLHRVSQLSAHIAATGILAPALSHKQQRDARAATGAIALFGPTGSCMRTLFVTLQFRGIDI